MPLDAQGAWSNEQVVTQAEIVATVDAAFPLEPVTAGERGSEPAARWRFRDGRGEIGVIPSVTQAFCDTCDRVRLTAEGMVRHCLFATRELDLRALLRAGATDDELADAIRGEVAAKWAGHQINQVHFIRPARSMSQIGG
jgi:cyclic pyranopterin phosphate synthase